MCPYCNGPLIQIDHYGEMLVGCIHCNRWSHPGDEHLIMELMEDDLDALRRDSSYRRGAGVARLQARRNPAEPTKSLSGSSRSPVD